MLKIHWIIISRTIEGNFRTLFGITNKFHKYCWGECGKKFGKNESKICIEYIGGFSRVSLAYCPKCFDNYLQEQKFWDKISGNFWYDRI